MPSIHGTCALCLLIVICCVINDILFLRLRSYEVLILYYPFLVAFVRRSICDVSAVSLRILTRLLLLPLGTMITVSIS